MSDMRREKGLCVGDIPRNFVSVKVEPFWTPTQCVPLISATLMVFLEFLSSIWTWDMTGCFRQISSNREPSNTFDVLLT